MTLSVAERVILFDLALVEIREHFRGAGLREVMTPVRLDAVALEPYIEPVRAEAGWLQTSPELPMKRLLCAGSGAIFQIAPVFRRAERGALHREEFRLVEWYRLGADFASLRRDAEAIVARVRAALAPIRGEPSRTLPWQTIAVLEVIERTCGLRLSGQEDAEGLERVVCSRRPDLWIAPPSGSGMDVQARALSAWTTWFSTWSDRCFDPWLASVPGRGVHLVEFPGSLAALAEVGPSVLCSTGGLVAHRFESYVDGVELVNGYRELRDADEQRQRFQAVAQLRGTLGLPELPFPETFLETLVAYPLPACVGAAMGLERLIMVACGERNLTAVLSE